MDQVIENERKCRNTESLVLDASGKEQKPTKPAKTPGAPGKRQQQQQGNGGNTSPATPRTQSGGPGGSTKSPGKGDEKGKKGKRSQGKQGDSSGGSDSEARSNKGKPLSQYDGKYMTELPPAEQCCVYWLWVKKDGTSMCNNHREGKDCKLPHKPNPSDAAKKTKQYAKLFAEHGQPNGPPKGVAGKAS